MSDIRAADTRAADAKAAFRLNLQQQKKRAKELLQAVRAGEVAAFARWAAHGNTAAPQAKPALAPALTNAQWVIARELGFRDWAALKTHIGSLDRARADIQRRRAPDAAPRTLHVRCGSDIQRTLLAAGFVGEFLEVSYPYCHGPVSGAADHLEIEARFIAEFTTPLFQVSFAAALQRRQEEESALAASAARFARIVLWMEHDCFDQLVLLRCLSQYASTQPLPALELISIDHFPGTTRFIGLGQLPAEALRLLWGRRRAVDAVQLALAQQAFAALRLEDPRPLAALLRTGCTALPYLAGALHRLLQELPWLRDGLSLTERLILQQLARCEGTFQQVFMALQLELDPLPFATDLQFLRIIAALQQTSQPLVVVTPSGNHSGDHWRHHRLQITTLGRAVLGGECDMQSLQPGGRWVGGVRVGAGCAGWRWDEARLDAVQR